MAAGSLIVQMAVDLARFRSDMGEAARLSNTSLREIQRSAEATVGQIERAFSGIGRIAGLFGIGFGAGELIRGLRESAVEAIRFGDEMQKASLRTGIGSAAFSQLAEAAKLADVQTESLSKGLRTMQVAISQAGSGGREAVTVFRAIGIEFASFRTLTPERQLETVADALKNLRDPADRARAGVALFGRSWDELAPFILQGSTAIRQAREEVTQLGAAFSDNIDAKKLAEADEAMKRLAAAWRGIARTLTVEVVPALTETLNLMTAITRVDLGKILGGFAGGPVAGLSNLARQLAVVRKEADDAAAARAHLLAVSRGGGFTPEAPGFEKEVTTRQSRAQAAGLESITVTARRITQSEFSQLYRELDSATQTTIEKQVAAWVKAEQQIKALQAGIATSTQTPLGTVVTQQRISAEESAKRLKALSDQFLEPIKVNAQKLPLHFQAATSGITQFAIQAARNIQNGFAQYLFDPFKQGLRGMLAGFIDVIRQMIAEVAASAILRSFFTLGAGAGGGIGKFFGGLLKGLAGGGTLGAGEAAIVGERGPELWIPQTAGMVVPAGAGGAVVLNYSIDARGADAERILAMMPALLRRTQDETVARVRELQRRGRL